MPELPEVETVARLVRPRLVGRKIEGVRVSWERSLGGLDARTFRSRITGSFVKRVGRRAKWIVFDLERCGAPAGHLLCHLRMSGRLYLSPFPEHLYMRAALSLDNGQHLVFADVRKFGRLILAESLEEALPSLGPDANTDEVDGAWMERELRKRKRALKPLLLDQSFLAGLGNIYVDEALWQAKIHPQAITNTIGKIRCIKLCIAIKDVLKRAIKYKGTTIIDFRYGSNEKGRFKKELKVFGRIKKPCSRCNIPIDKIFVSQRGTYYCKKCQRI